MSTQDQNQFTAPGVTWTDRAVNGVIAIAALTVAVGIATALRS
jgi:hypothetical protein